MSTPVSPERKNTYSSKHKRGRSAHDDGDIEMTSDGDEPSVKVLQAKIRATVTAEAPGTPKKHTSLTPKRTSASMSSASKKHNRSASSGSMGPPTTPVRPPGTIVAAMKPSSATGTPLRYSPAKPPSAASPPRHGSPSLSDSVSVAGTASVADDVNTGGTIRKRKTASERQREIAASSYCGELEPARAYCTTCATWIELSAKTPYSIRPWTHHLRDTHDEGQAPRKRKAKADDEEGADDASTVAPSVTHTTSDVGADTAISPTTESHRRGLLRADSRIKEVRPHEVLCRQCEQWVKLHVTRKYEVQRWHTHCDGCSGIQPSDRVAAAERRMKLVNDSQVKTHAPRHVVCAKCGASVELEGEGDYNLEAWEMHKTTGCAEIDSSDNAPASLAASAPASTEARPPPSVSSTDSTLAAERGTSASPARITGKRRRESDQDAAEGDARPTTRARTNSYEAPSGLWNWLAMPLKIFAKGFRQGAGLSVAPTEDDTGRVNVKIA